MWALYFKGCEEEDASAKEERDEDRLTASRICIGGLLGSEDAYCFGTHLSMLSAIQYDGYFVKVLDKWMRFLPLTLLWDELEEGMIGE